jgi:hypothetical protein
MRFLFFGFIACLFFSSCIVIHSGNTSSGPLLSVKDQYVDIAEGRAKAIFVLGFGNLKNDRLVLNARKDMYSKRHLVPQEYYANLTTDISRKYILGTFIQLTRVTVSADVLKSGDITETVFADRFTKKIATPVKSKTETPLQEDNYSLITNGDSLYYSSDNNRYGLYVAAMKEKETLVLIPTQSTNKTILVSLPDNLFFIKNKTVNGIVSGQSKSFEVKDEFSSGFIPKTGLVLGLSNNTALIDCEKSFYVVPLTKLNKK